jgi:hypothetical protein
VPLGVGLHRIGWWRPGQSPLLGSAACRKAGSAYGVQSPSRAGSVVAMAAVGVQRQAGAQRGRAELGGRCY